MDIMQFVVSGDKLKGLTPNEYHEKLKLEELNSSSLYSFSDEERNRLKELSKKFLNNKKSTK